MKESAKIFQQKLRELGFSNEVVELPESTRTAQEAAEAIGCEVKHIAKSIIFKRGSTDTAVLVIASGSNRIDEAKIEEALGERLEKANANFVREKTGYVIGGVAPIGHIHEPIIFIDEDLFQYDKIWAAAGHPKAVFQLTPAELLEMTKGRVMVVKE